MANWNISDIVVVDPFAKCTRGEATDPFHGAGRGRSWGSASDGGCGDSWLHSTGQTSVCVSLSLTLFLSLCVCVLVVGLSLVNNNNDCHWNWPLKWRLGGFWLLFWLVFVCQLLPVGCCRRQNDLWSAISTAAVALCLPSALPSKWNNLNVHKFQSAQQNKLDSINRSHAASAQQLSLSLSAIWTPIESRFCYFALHTHTEKHTYLHTPFTQSLITRWIADLSTERADGADKPTSCRNLGRARTFGRAKFIAFAVHEWIDESVIMPASAHLLFIDMIPCIQLSTLRCAEIMIVI